MQNQNPFQDQNQTQNQNQAQNASVQDDRQNDSPASDTNQSQNSPQSINWDEIFAQLNDTNPAEDQNFQTNTISSPTQPHDTDRETEMSDYVNSYNPVSQDLNADSVQNNVVAEPTSQFFDNSNSNTPLSTPDPISSESDESLESQNIFELLGVNDGSDEEKEKFLDELQQVIWEDFLENDVELLVTSEEKQKVDAILAKQDLSELEKQEELVVYLETLIPDLEEVMLEKALDLKKDLFAERIAGFKEYYAGNEQILADINRAEALKNQGRWKSSAEIMNAVK